MVDFIKKNTCMMFEMLKELCRLPAPSGHEEMRAEYCKQWLEQAGAKGVYIDDALNVVYPLNCGGGNSITVFSAHTDTVFPDTEPMDYYEDKDTISFPGAGDNTASVVVLLILAKYFVEKNILPKDGILFVFNSCEEGLGNLKGTKALFSNYAGRIRQFVSFDSKLSVVHDKCVGSHRYHVEVNTAGGHSFNDFGNANAISIISEIINDIYKIDVPEKALSKTTYNVGTVTGGTSVNTIAQNASMLCECRSDNKECLSYMTQQFYDIFQKHRENGVSVSVTSVGERPCSDIESEKIDRLKNCVVPVIEKVVGEKVVFTSASTDCNIPLSLGIPALCIGVCNYKGMHTREESLDKESLLKGLEIAILLGEKIAYMTEKE